MSLSNLTKYEFEACRVLVASSYMLETSKRGSEDENQEAGTQYKVQCIFF